MRTRPLDLVDPQSTLGKIMARAVPDGECLVWTGHRQASGHGVINARETTGWRAVKVHRVVWTVANGPIPDGLVIDHLCGKQACVRLDHLEPVTQGTNARRGNPVPSPTCVKCGASDWLPNGASRRCRPCFYAKRREWLDAHPGKQAEYDRRHRHGDNLG